ncbi:chemotaxis response regulator protein-glutamate methylesterase [Acetivibrio thermocellus]|uniref:protein-glutamate methylesterase/protein-glutamine glutaminase n=1 Tax=Acetivibrio thermocellus TaxID=1515 RepID=UPI0010A69E89|nr:chemotaxis response regulator protein-glutamate methylesterase [Acetivibrio thermocellus]THJ77507.1 chemotaxis response regulator protein-glutamate methylesterase [Acetivibrio thermocellus]UWV46863.1 chemotaxis response regulator protein-glutamate methylesterase [Acetivibrio thermocellus]
MQQYGVLVVDDSSFMRRCISLIIEKDPQLFVIGIARSGAEAIEKVHRLKPDIVTMDVEMPEMDGMTALKEIMRTCPVPVVMLSNRTDKDPKATFQALELGAADFYLKSVLLQENVKPEIIKEFLDKLKAIAQKAKKTADKEQEQNAVSENMSEILENILNKPESCIETKSGSADLLIIGCSTGGPSALQSILPRFPKDTHVPIVVLQHMPPGFTKPLAERFDAICNLHVKEAEDGDILEAGNIYIAPAGYQTFLDKKADNVIALRVEDCPAVETLYRPSINVTLDSAAPIYRERLLSVILTGMGNDGLIGCETVKKYNGKVIVEAEESCVVYGMPKVIYEAGLADVQVPLSNIFHEIMHYI